MKRIPVDEALAGMAVNLTRSTDLDERAAGASILESNDSADARIVLQNLATSDPDTIVRIEAIHALGSIGDLQSLKILELYNMEFVNLPPPTDAGLGSYLRKVLRGSLNDLRLKYPD